MQQTSTSHVAIRSHLRYTNCVLRSATRESPAYGDCPLPTGATHNHVVLPMKVELDGMYPHKWVIPNCPRLTPSSQSTAVRTGERVCHTEWPPRICPLSALVLASLAWVFWRAWLFGAVCTHTQSTRPRSGTQSR
jgi:hypothetical protein